MMESVLKKISSLKVIQKTRSFLAPPVIDHLGVSICTDSKHINAKITAKILDGEYESDEIYFIDEYVNGDETVVELGGCIGFTACYTNKIIDKNNDHIVVEANKNLIPIIKHNKGINDCDFKVIQSAYSYGKSRAKISVPENAWGGSLYRNSDRTYNVDCITIKDIIEKFDISKFTLIADIEGSEISLINNELDIIESECSLVIIEFHDKKNVYSNVQYKIKRCRKKLAKSSLISIDKNNSSTVEVYSNPKFNSFHKEV